MATFKSAFAEARAAFLKGGPKTFTWQGKSYTTDLASETKKKPKAETAPPRRPKPPGAERPRSRPANTGPSVMSEAPKKGNAPAADAPLTTKPATGNGNKLAIEQSKALTKKRAETKAALDNTAKQGGGRLDEGVKRMNARKAAGPKFTPLGKSTGIGGRAAEAVKSFMSGFKVNADKNKTVAKAPNRAEVGKAKKK